MEQEVFTKSSNETGLEDDTGFHFTNRTCRSYVACLVFLDDQFDKFEKELGNEEQMVDILTETWGRCLEAGHAEALKLDLSERVTALVT